MRWNIVNVFHVHEKLAKLSHMEWFLEYLIHATRQGSVNILVFNMSSDRNDFRLILIWDFLLIINFSNPIGRFVSVHKRHVAVHKDQGILMWLIVLD